MASSEKKKTLSPSKTRRSPRGQAMVEYSVVSHFLLMGGSLVMMKIIPRLFESINTFYDSVYTVIETAAL